MQPDPQLPNVGDLLDRGKYRIDAIIGEGGMGVVFAATHMQMGGRRRAIKWLLPKLARDESAVRRFLAEANIAARIDHPNVVSPIDVSVDTGAPYIVMELLEGEALSDVLASQPLTVEEVGQLFMPILDGVAAAHDQNIVHRDLKPGNIFLVRSGSGGRIPKVLDFGIAKVLDGRHTQGTLTDHGALLGTLQYMSPEQLSDASNVGPQTDVYALGVILYRMLSGKLPFEGNLLDLALRIRDGRPTHVGLHAPALPEGLAAAVMRALAGSLQERYHDVRSFGAALAPFFLPNGSNWSQHPARSQAISRAPFAVNALGGAAESPSRVSSSKPPSASPSAAPASVPSAPSRENSTFHPVTTQPLAPKTTRVWLISAALAAVVGVAGIISAVWRHEPKSGATLAATPTQPSQVQHIEPRAAAGQPVNSVAHRTQPDAGEAAAAAAPAPGWTDLGGVEQPAAAIAGPGTKAIGAPNPSNVEAPRPGVRAASANSAPQPHPTRQEPRAGARSGGEKPKADPLDTILGQPSKVLDTILDSTPTER